MSIAEIQPLDVLTGALKVEVFNSTSKYYDKTVIKLNVATIEGYLF